ncbi:PEP-CTERM/exosortase system-associated acyltransferase [Methylomonas rivi]|uniref:PEP-CTERM/exosortase system-associated acyltransferase n=1 Tax=Methylomonas rivi TaxID=2952226 RepID=A0ABT1U9D7_9GAMM|nr:PEP-CTERM/exosortase system-associated acyltransferase [Methylomonas sp. WSC-6]MBS4049636.1 PEP-CTERM/exosortase system-associated acyltransferase [Methylomonas sp.]MCQ8130241.1 PEP-CTERM/exosortase system-associated acyltransferase [Methylomonas sp. WSC-6]
MNDKSDLTLTESFERYFKVELAVSDIQKQQVYGVRYRVYCEEFKYEAVDLFPDGLETDEYDQVSRHCLVIHRRTGMPAGCVRLVPALGGRDEMPLPLEKFCGSSLNSQQIDDLGLDRSTVCEISRLAVDGAFRRRSGESLTRFGEISGLHFSDQEQRSFSLIAVACFLAATAMTEMDNRTNVFAMMEPFLPRLMHRSGIDFHRIGKDMYYHGIRAPYFITTQSALENMHSDLFDLYVWIKNNIIE